MAKDANYNRAESAAMYNMPRVSSTIKLTSHYHYTSQSIIAML